MSTMTTELKEQLTLLNQLFPPSHERFRVTRCSIEEICCVFVAPDGKTTVVVTGTIKEKSESGVWYTENDDQKLAEALASFSETSSTQNALLTQVHKIISILCSQYGATVPAEAAKLQCNSSKRKQEKHAKIVDSSSESGVETEFEDPGTESKDSDSSATEGIPQSALLQLKKVATGTASTSAGGKQSASQRLMREFRELLQSSTYKRGDFSVEMYEDNLFRWRVKVKKVDPDSALAKDLVTLKMKTGQDFVELDFAFGASYPFAPPVVAVVSPRMVDGHVAGGGAVCLELLTPEGWRCVYTVESIMVQVISVLCGGNARVQFNCLEPYDVSTAGAVMARISEFHRAHGWNTPPKAAG